MGSFSQRSKDAMKGIHPDLRKVMDAAIIDSPVDFTVVMGGRTTAQQQALYAQGRTKPGPRVTNADGVRNKSNHQAKADGYFHAVDLYPYYDGQVQIHDKQVIPKLRQIATHIKKKAKDMGIKITWGGDFKTIFDPPHFELG